MPSANALNLRKLREKARREGRCTTCRARDAKPGILSCQQCIDESAAKKILYRKDGLCVTCCRPSPSGTVRCSDCTKTMGARSRAAKRASGKCARCKWPAHAPSRHCLVCLADLKERQLALRGVYSGRVTYCSGCGSPGHNIRTCTAVAA